MHVAACMAIASKGKTTRKHRTYVPFHVMYWYKPPRRAVSSDGALRPPSTNIVCPSVVHGRLRELIEARRAR